MQPQPRFRIAVDVGGTFIDFVLLDPQTGEVCIEKESSLPDRLAAQIVKGVGRFGVTFPEVAQLFHGTTVGVNALVQERGAKVGLITTKGFRDVLELGRGRRKEIYNWVFRAPKPLVERSLRREVPERLSFRGEIVTPLDLEALDREVDLLLERGADALAVTFLHAYANPGHELAARDRIRLRYPDLPISLSHSITGEWREYERTSTTVLNAFIQPVVKRYLDSLAEQVQAEGYTRPLAIMQSSGGVCSAEIAAEKPIRTLMSGPAGGVIGSKFLCDRLGIENAICTDVGGTTYDVAIIEQGEILERSSTEIHERPVLGSLIDIISIGAGGGSIAWLDHRSGLRVGPQSAGAMPGPACFGKGATEPTVTDAHVVLGRLDPAYFLGGRMTIDADAARRAIEDRIARPLGLGVMVAAEGILAIAETNMANAIRGKTVARGLDPRDFAMLAYGGGGGMFACAVAEELEIPRVIVPVAPANFSAWGLLTSDYVEDEVRTKMTPFDRRHLGDHLEALAQLEATAKAAIAGYGFPASEIELIYRFDLRFRGQEYTITVGVDEPFADGEAVLRETRQKFVAAHRQLYGHGDIAADLEIVSLRCRAIGRVEPPQIRAIPEPPRSGGTPSRDIYFSQAGGFVACPVVARATLTAGTTVLGPAIIDEWTTTTIVPPRWQASGDSLGNLILTPAGK